MGKINVLPPFMADLIAAGEVVERPASVVKELLENAIDAGATACTVEIQQGGMTYIRVTDDGCGMGREDARTAFLRHATSKIKNQDDLEHIGTLGFRGEALAAISAVSRVEMLTREREAEYGTAVSVEGGTITEVDDAACPPGTTVIVRDLFFNTPARMKFMKKDASEAGAVRIAVVNEALSHPEISVKYIKDGKEEIYTAGDNVLKNTVYSVLGGDVALNMEELRWSGEDMEITGYVGKPVICRGNRAQQFFFVNGRCIKAAALTASLEAAYKNRAMVGKFPVCVIMIKMKLSAVDVNVHPAKTEVRFFNGKKVCDAVYRAAMDALDHEMTIFRSNLQREKAEENLMSEILTSMPSKKNFYYPEKSMDEKVSSGDENDLVSESDVFENGVAASNTSTAAAMEYTANSLGTQFRFNSDPAAYRRMTVSEIKDELEERRGQGERTTEHEMTAGGQLALPEEKKCTQEDYKVVGEILTTYIVVDCGDRIILIDKHACHERILYDRFKANMGNVMRQTLISPIILKLSAEEKDALIENAEKLEEIGFELEDFGDNSIAVRTCPADINFDQAASAVEEIGEEIVKYGRANGDARDHVIATLACKAAIKAGKKSSLRELQILAEKVLSGEIKYCPHGRPVSVEITKYKLDKMFGRV